MVVKINFKLPNKQSKKVAQKAARQFNSAKIIRLLFLSVFVLFFGFIFFGIIKIALTSKDIYTSKILLEKNRHVAEKLSVKLEKNIDVSNKSYNFLMKQLPSIEILSMLQEKLSTCNGIAVNNISADCYGLNLSGTCQDANELNRFAEALGKSELVASVNTPAFKDAEDISGTNFTLFVKLNSMRYALTNDPGFKQEQQ